MKNAIVGLKELRENIEIYISRIKKGDSFIVVRRSKPVMKISSPEEEPELWEQIADFRKIKKGGVDARDILKEFRPTSAQKKALSRAEDDLKQGKTLSYHEVAKKLGFAD